MQRRSRDENFYPESLASLMELLRTLPGVGRRGAERLALALLRWEPAKRQELGALIGELESTLGRCPTCGNLANQGELCQICQKPGRDETLLCVVEEFSQIAALEKSNSFRGRYHVLGGRLSPLDGQTAEQLKIAELLERLESSPVQELILALSHDVEGRATAVYLSELCRDKVPVITQLAAGLPVNCDPAYADAATLGVALGARRPV